MPAITRKDHIIVHSRPQSEDFRPRNAGSSEKEYSIPENRVSHGKTLIQAYEKALEEQRDHTDDGFRMLFSSQPDEDMPLQSLERAGAGQVQLLSSYFTVSGTEKDAQKTLHANVYIPSNRTNIETKHTVRGKNLAVDRFYRLAHRLNTNPRRSRS